MKRVYSAAIMFSFFIGLSFLFTKISLGFADTNIVLAHRFTLGYFVFMIYRRILGLRLLPSLSDIVSILPIAICYPIAFFITQGLGLNYLTSSEGGMIHALVPGVTLLLSSLFLKEKVNFLKLFFTTLSVTGVIFIFTMKNVNITDMNILGVVYASLSVVVSSIYTLLAKSKLKKFNYNDLTYVMLFIGFIFLNFLYLLRTEPF
uniref:DMT family transporter n=1 Tax=Acetoanaerobium sticklandii TaxID=1511 RepID=UPI003A8F6259